MAAPITAQDGDPVHSPVYASKMMDAANQSAVTAFVTVQVGVCILVILSLTVSLRPIALHAIVRCARWAAAHKNLAWPHRVCC